MKRLWLAAALLSLPALLIGTLSVWLFQTEKERIENDYLKEAEDWCEKVIPLLADREEIEKSQDSSLGLSPGVESKVGIHLSSGPLLIPYPELEAAYHQAIKLPARESLIALRTLSGHKNLPLSRTSSHLPLKLLVFYQLATRLTSGPEKEQAITVAKKFLFHHPNEINELLARDLELTLEEKKRLKLQAFYLSELKPPFDYRDKIEVKEHPEHFVVLLHETIAIIPKTNLAKAIANRIRFFEKPTWLDSTWLRESITWRNFNIDLGKEFPIPSGQKASPIKLASKTHGPITFTVLGNTLAIQENIAQRLRRLKLVIMAATAITALASLFIFFTLRKQQQLATLQSDFVASVSHELRTPIASIRLLAERLEKEDSLPQEKSDQYHRLISNESHRLGNLVENILDFSRIENGRKFYHFEPMNLRALILETLQLIQPNIEERKHTLKTDISLNEDDSPTLDPLAIRQLLLNLLDNALKFTPSPGTITLIASTTSSTINLVMTDTGPGIPESDRIKVFQRFYRRNRNTEITGTGIGLSLVQHIVKAHEGTITIDDNPDHHSGTRLNISLPFKN